MFGGGRRPVARGPIQGGDVSTTIELTLAEAAAGTTAEVRFDAVALCEHCHGNGAEPGTPIETCPTLRRRGQLRAVTRTPFGQVMRTTVCDQCEGDGRDRDAALQGVPWPRSHRRVASRCPSRFRRGIADGQRIRVTGRGHAGDRGGPPGDLYVLVRVAADERFVRDGDNLLTAVDVSAPLAALGTTIEVPTLDGPTDLEIPAGTQPHETLVLRGRGMPSLRGRRHGDLRVVVNVVIPRRLTAEQRELTGRLARVADR